MKKADYNKWYLSAVKSSLILDRGMMEDEANNIIQRSQLEKTIEEEPYLANHYDPRSTAQELKGYAK